MNNSSVQRPNIRKKRLGNKTVFLCFLFLLSLNRKQKLPWGWNPSKGCYKPPWSAIAALLVQKSCGVNPCVTTLGSNLLGKLEPKILENFLKFVRISKILQNVQKNWKNLNILENYLTFIFLIFFEIFRKFFKKIWNFTKFSTIVEKILNILDFFNSRTFFENSRRFSKILKIF